MIESLVQDLRYAGRTFRRSPGFFALALLTIAIGVGSNAAIFSVVNAVLLQSLPFPHPERLFVLSQQSRLTKASAGNVAPANFLDWRQRNHSFAGMTAWRGATFALSSGDRPERVGGAIVNANFFEVLGTAPAVGRLFHASDEQPGAPRVVVISDGLWRQRFGGRSDVIGDTVRLNGEPHSIVGVAPPGIEYPDQTQLWVPPHWLVPDDPLAPNQDPSRQRDHAYFQVLSRLEDGVTPARARADMDAVAASLERDYPNQNQNEGMSLISLHDEIVGAIRDSLLLLLAAVGVLMLIATTNVSGLLIARATTRHQEMAIRIALGATRGRVVRQLVTESVLLALTGGACGVMAAMWLVEPLLAIIPAGLLSVREARVDGHVLLFGLAVSTSAGLVFGLAPARQLLRLDLHDDLKQTARSGTSGAQRRVRAALVVAEIALSLVLLVAAALTIRSLIKLQREPAGFDPSHVLTLAVNLPNARYPTPALKAEFWGRSLDALRQIHRVDTVGATSRLPLSGGNSTRGLTIDGHPRTPPAQADYRTATPDYFRALRIPLLRGRTFAYADREDRPRVAVIGASMADAFWPNLDPIGHQLAIGEPPITVVGVVGDVHHASLAAPPRPTMYVPFRQDPWPSMTFALRLTGSADVSPFERSASVHASVRDAIWQIDQDQAVGAILTMEERLGNSLQLRRFIVTLLGLFGIAAVALAAIGLYGVLAFIVEQRRREIGVRMALGASPRDVMADVMGEGLRLAAVGVATGIGLAVAVTRVLASLLYGTSATDAATFVGVAVLLVAVAAAASALPAFRASRVDPLVALRED